LITRIYYVCNDRPVTEYVCSARERGLVFECEARKRV